MRNNEKVEQRRKVRRRVRAKISGTPERPRLSVFKSNKHIYAQVIDDVNGVTLAAASTNGSELKDQVADKPGVEQAEAVGTKIAENAKAAGVEKIVFDRSGYRYHGRVKALADAARKGGLSF